MKRMTFAVWAVIVTMACSLCLKGEERASYQNEISTVTFENKLGTEIVNLNYTNTDIKDVLKFFSRRLDTNIMFSESVSGKISIQLKNIPFNEAFQVILEKMDLMALQRSPNVVEILKKNEVNLRNATFYLRARKAGEAKDIMKELLTPEERGKTVINADGLTNSLIVTATPEVISKMAQLIDQLDNRMPKVPQIFIKARLIETQKSDNLNTGVSWADALRTDKGGDPDNRTNLFFQAGNFTLGGNGKPALNVASIYPSGAAIDTYAIINNSQLNVVLNFLASNGLTKTISEPSILAENLKEAKIHVGQSLPVRTITTAQSGITTQDIKYIPEGVDLSVKPIVIPGSTLVSMRVMVNVSELVNFIEGNPVTSERYATTEVNVDTGKTVIIGGLIKEKDILSDSGIPLLKDIPVLGYLFRSHAKSKVKTELIVFLTPEIIY